VGCADLPQLKENVAAECMGAQPDPVHPSETKMRSNTGVSPVRERLNTDGFRRYCGSRVKRSLACEPVTIGFVPQDLRADLRSEMALFRKRSSSFAGEVSGLFGPLAFAEPHARPAAVFLDEFNSGRLKRSSYYL
jgi:hypothetical protein